MTKGKNQAKAAAAARAELVEAKASAAAAESSRLLAEKRVAELERTVAHMREVGSSEVQAMRRQMAADAATHADAMNAIRERVGRIMELSSTYMERKELTVPEWEELAYLTKDTPGSVGKVIQGMTSSRESRRTVARNLSSDGFRAYKNASDNHRGSK